MSLLFYNWSQKCINAMQNIEVFLRCQYSISIISPSSSSLEIIKSSATAFARVGPLSMVCFTAFLISLAVLKQTADCTLNMDVFRVSNSEGELHLVVILSIKVSVAATDFLLLVANLQGLVGFPVVGGSNFGMSIILGLGASVSGVAVKHLGSTLHNQIWTP